MAEGLQQIRNQFNEYLQGLEKKQKIKIVVSAALILLTLTAIIYYFTRPQYVVLYSNLDAKQAGEIMNTLEGSGIRAKLGETSSTILVQKSDYQRSQVVVATEGLPQARFSYEDFFSGNNFMKTSEEKSKEFTVALGNELSKIIEEIPGINKSYVTLSIPENTGFIRNNQDQGATASVFLNLDYNAALDPNSVTGITHLVSNAVQGLSPENVTVHGPDGRVLNATSSNSPEIFGPSDQLSLQQAVKDDLEKSITDFLSTVYGYGNVVVMTNVKLDFNSEITEIQEFSPPIDGETEGIVRSMQDLQQRVVNSAAGGAPGTDTNTEDIPQYVVEDQENSLYYEANRTINYEINELRKKIVKAQGQVQDITVAVYLNRNAINGGELTDEERRELENIISAAAGLDTRVVRVAVQEFNNALEDQIRLAMEGAATGGQRIPLWALGLAAAALLGGGLFLIVRTNRRKKKELEEVIGEIPSEPQELMQEIDLELSGSQVKQQLERLVNKKPDAVAQLLRNWLSEE
ncbi:flagellar M-ring protein FliF [Clostridium aceticum]|uniref:Flagellar M-ring protein n=1 Tax=Clostridium aceticum TaxID=84022 RepID=A0A0D8I6W1_9CLOT|nr:flagellar basal-body MS-ring/collar protein FliF [Clostridium aceticum]AKL95485.1 flagellar M-ring protein FliF [Clostridium aceticum]KJF25968.1 flagellar M-ring protein FliF [Clostridium aceticum]